MRRRRGKKIQVVPWKPKPSWVYFEILAALGLLKNKMERENPQSLFIWVLESKERAYQRKFDRAKKKENS